MILNTTTHIYICGHTKILVNSMYSIQMMYLIFMLAVYEYTLIYVLLVMQQ